LPSACSSASSARAANWTYFDKSLSVNRGGADIEQALTPQKLISLWGGVPDKPPLDTQVLEVQEYAAIGGS
jgi:hypothetical protein